MSSGYRALLQSLDETEKDVTLGLGRSIKIKKPKSSCCRRNACLCICITTTILCGLVLSVGIPILLTVPIQSSWHWSHWIRWWQRASRPNETLVSDNIVQDFQTENGTAWPSTPGADIELPETSAGNTTVTFIHDAINHLHQMMEWTREQYNQTPKVPLIIGLSALLLVILTIIWMLVYRKIMRRQRRRTIGKLVTDLQSGKTLLNSDDSEDD